MKIKIFSSIFLLLSYVNCFPQKVINLYKGQVPGSENWTQKERQMNLPGINITLIQNVPQPTLRIYAPPVGKGNGVAVIVAPGGVFETIVEGFEEWMENLGFIK